MLFWYLQLSDIYCPVEQYTQTLEKVKAKDFSTEANSKKKVKGDKLKEKSLNCLKDERDKTLGNIEQHEKYIKNI